MAAPQSTERGLVIQIGRLEIDVPRSLGYFGAVAAAVAFEVIEPPLGIFIAAVPLVKMLGKANLPGPLRFVAAVADGAAQPVGGEAKGTVRLRDPDQEAAHDVAAAEAAERGEKIKVRTSARRATPRTAPAPA